MTASPVENTNFAKSTTQNSTIYNTRKQKQHNERHTNYVTASLVENANSAESKTQNTIENT